MPAPKREATAKRRGRPPNPDLLSFDSFAAAAEHIGGDCTPELLKAAKKAGCPAFRNGRIYVVELTDWLKDNPVDPSQSVGKEAMQIRKLAAECARLEFDNAIREKKYVLIDEVNAINARVDADIINSLQEAFSDALIQKLDGVTFAERRVAINAAIDQVLERIHAPGRA